MNLLVRARLAILKLNVEALVVLWKLVDEEEVASDSLKVHAVIDKAVAQESPRPLLVLRGHVRKTIGAALELIDRTLEKRVRVLFQPILDYLADQGAARSATEIETHFKNQMNLEGVTTACEWLADKEVITKVSSPVRLFEKGRTQFEEMAFYYQENHGGKS